MFQICSNYTRSLDYFQYIILQYCIYFDKYLEQMYVVTRNPNHQTMQPQPPETLRQATQARVDCAAAHNLARKTAALSCSIPVLVLLPRSRESFARFETSLH